MLHFVNPIYFILAILIAGVVLLYFFRKQYKEILNSSNLLWEQTMNEWQASPWLKKLQQNLLFWLQIFALLLLMFALVRPYWDSKGLKGEHNIFILDTSATMAAGKEINTFEKAKKQMLEMLEQHHGQKVTIITAGEKPKVVLNKETNKNIILKELKNVRVTYEHENMKAALRLADSFADNHQSSIHVFTEGVSQKQIPEMKQKTLMEIHNMGNSLNNVSLTSFGVEKEIGKLAALAVIENQSPHEKKLSLHVKDEKNILFEKELSFKANEKRIIEIPDLPERSYFVAEVITDDDYKVDNSMNAVMAESNQDVFTIGELNPFFGKALKTMGIESTQLNDKAQWNGIKNGIFISEGVSLEAIPAKPLIFVNKGGASEKLALENPISKIEDPLLQYVDLNKTYIEYAFKPVKGEWETIASSGEIPLIQKGSVNGHPAIMLNFPLEATDWPLQPGFPIFLYNSYQWLNKQTGFLGYFQPGEEKWLNSDESGANWEIYSESGESIDSIDTTAESFKAPAKPGIYQAVSGDSVAYFSVTLDEREKELGKDESFSLNKKNFYAKEWTKIENDSVWFWLALVALVLLMIEWEVYRRGFRN
ncbi:MULTISPECIES: BatA and WFA domain-containing protein [unclassified Bacillus (in: firmicutes)]|uniref:vWA domain-containing protein n=1 Tax=unclassified Bacillus (in: firmicutes) TaxID=185979 RepID=UPI0008E77F6B|nr:MULTISPECIES: BatA and WFA domain-containing protein [unclassified Bacillus (in: firmicutes)]SFA74483.1 von Willebrand factor type A domain-containing protein [Bacillus sp. UNCCL13]SFQ64677.1 von Willebrand factor type A domain-containing protein [Bacillus sp. cl95]